MYTLASCMVAKQNCCDLTFTFQKLRCTLIQRDSTFYCISKYIQFANTSSLVFYFQIVDRGLWDIIMCTVGAPVDWCSLSFLNQNLLVDDYIAIFGAIECLLWWPCWDWDQTSLLRVEFDIRKQSPSLSLGRLMLCHDFLFISPYEPFFLFPFITTRGLYFVLCTGYGYLRWRAVLGGLLLKCIPLQITEYMAQNVFCNIFR